jgi:hypothetical protein
MAYTPLPTGVIKLIIDPNRGTRINGISRNLPVDIHPSV